jgi:hypothetical protein
MTLIDEIKKINHRHVLPQFLKNNSFKIICELGVADGNHFLNLLKYAEPELLVGVDIWTNDGDFLHCDYVFDKTKEFIGEKYKNLLEKTKDDNRVILIRNYTSNACKLFEDGFFDFVYIDADHSFKGSYEDMRLWWPKVKKNGILSGHDCQNKGYKRVKKALDKFLLDIAGQYSFLHFTSGRCPSFFILK